MKGRRAGGRRRGPPKTAASTHSRHSVPQKRSSCPTFAGVAGGRPNAGSRAVRGFAEGTGTAPGHILRPVVGQHFLRRTEIGDRRLEHFPHQRAARARAQPIADDEAAVVVEEDHQVDPAILAFEQKRKQIALPELVRPRPFKVPHAGGCGAVATSSSS